MSWVANLMVSCDLEDRVVVEQFSAWLQAQAPQRETYSTTPQPTGVGFLRRITVPHENQWGGWKNPEVDVWAGALNHADLEAVLTRVTEMPWRYPGAVQVFLQDQEESYFRLYMFREGQLRQYSPDPPPDADEQHAW